MPSWSSRPFPLLLLTLLATGLPSSTTTWQPDASRGAREDALPNASMKGAAGRAYWPSPLPLSRLFPPLTGRGGLKLCRCRQSWKASVAVKPPRASRTKARGGELSGRERGSRGMEGSESASVLTRPSASLFVPVLRTNASGRSPPVFSSLPTFPCSALCSDDLTFAETVRAGTSPPSYRKVPSGGRARM